MTRKLRSVEGAKRYDSAKSFSRALIARELIGLLEERKEIIRATYDTQMEERVHRINEVDTFIALSLTTLDVTSEEK